MGIKVAGVANAIDIDDRGALRTINVPAKALFNTAGKTGTIGAGAASASVFTMRLSPTATCRAYIWKMNLAYCTITNMSASPAATNNIALWRFRSATPSGGGALGASAKRSSGGPASQMADIRISTTAGLTMTNVTFDASSLYSRLLTTSASAGNAQEWTWGGRQGGNIDFPLVILQPGEGIALRNGASFDATGTWQAMVQSVEWSELAFDEWGA